MNQNKPSMKLLWTGGWDSTFQLIYLISRGARVQPYYLIDLKRRSLQNELATMTLIKQMMFERFPNSKELVLPTIFQMVSEIDIDTEIESAFLKMKAEKHMGLQYLWLASYCKARDIKDMILSIEKAVKPDPGLWAYRLEDILIPNRAEPDLGYMINPALKNTKEYVLFKSFSFPLLDRTKKDMYAIAKEEGWLHILEKTWFCLFPTKNNKPCGVCKPCQQYIEEGMAFRFSYPTILLNKFTNRIENPVKKVVKQMIYTLSFGRLMADRINNP